MAGTSAGAKKGWASRRGGGVSIAQRTKADLGSAKGRGMFRSAPPGSHGETRSLRMAKAKVTATNRASRLRSGKPGAIKRAYKLRFMKGA